ncbi:MAG: tetratricopeptide repeat protein, partial [Syntrophales bacterium]
ELGITYRANNQNAKAIETFERALAIDPKHLPPLNELGITYRESNQADEAIEICRRAIKISRQRQPNLNLLQIYLFFKPDRQKAKENYDVLMISPRPRAFNSSRKKYEDIIRDMDSILSTSFDELQRYESFLFLSIQYRSYHKVLSLLEKLDKKFPANSRIKSRLGKTFSNQVIDQQEKGWSYLKDAIQLFKKENDSRQLQHHIIYYFYNLMHHQQMKLLDRELNAYIIDLIHDAAYFRFMAHCSFVKNQDIDEAIIYFEKAIDIAEDVTKKKEYAESLLRFLSERNSKLYGKYFSKYEKLL